MSLDTINNGDTGLQARTKINAAIAAVNGLPIQSGTAVIHGFTSMGDDAYPATGSIDLPDLDGDFHGTIFIGADSSYDRTITLAASDPGDGSAWVNPADHPVSADLVAAVFDAVSTAMSGIATVTVSGNHADLQAFSTGSGSTLYIETTIDGASVTGGTGTDAAGPNGEVNNVTLVTAPSLRKMRLVRAFVSYDAPSEDGRTVELGLAGGTGFTTLCSHLLSATPGTYEMLPRSADELSAYLPYSYATGLPLVVRFGSDGGIPSTATAITIAASWELL